MQTHVQRMPTGVGSLLVLFVAQCAAQQDLISLNLNGTGRIRYGGIGAISGGGATSKLLISYPEPHRSEILDLLFRPRFAASLQILKVEIGGDAQSTDGSEASHRHTLDEDPNFERGYEWWLMKEAKRRNAKIKLWALPWAFPGWVDPSGSGNPYKEPNLTANYVAEWVVGARDRHGLHIDMVGCWNERNWNSDYLKALRAALDENSLQNTSIIAPDGHSTDLAEAMLEDPDLFKVVDALGEHYPGTTTSTPTRQVAVRGNKQIFASEDYGVYFDETGAKAWARLLNQNYVNGMMSGTLAWNLVSSYYSPYNGVYYGPRTKHLGPAPLDALPYRLCGLMHAAWPWSRHYAPTPQLYVTAHHTQFTEVGWSYLPLGAGSGRLKLGGSMVALVSPDGHGLTMVFEKVSWPGSQSAWQGLPEYNTSGETISLWLPEPWRGTNLHLWKSDFTGGCGTGALTNFFVRQPDASVSSGGLLVIDVCADCMITVTTEVGHKGSFSPSPPAAPFPSHYSDNFNKYNVGQQPDYLTDQAGSFELVPDERHVGEKVLRQMVMQKPVTWSSDEVPLSVIGNSNWTDISMSIDVMFESNGLIWIGARLLQGQPDPNVPGPNSPPSHEHKSVELGNLVLTNSSGVFLSMLALEQKWRVTLYPLGAPVAEGGLPITVEVGTWYRLQLDVNGDHLKGFVNGIELFAGVDISACTNKHGFAAIGTGGFYAAQFDNISITASVEESGATAFSV